MPMIDALAGRARANVGPVPRPGSARPPSPTHAHATGAERQWSAALGRQVAAGDGKPRSGLLRGLDKVRYAAGKTIGSLTLGKVAMGMVAFGAAAACVALALPLSPFIAIAAYKSKGWMAAREAKAEAPFKAQAGKQWLDDLREAAGPSRFGADLEGVMHLVEQHAAQTGKRLSPQELRQLVTVGEAVALRVQSPKDEGRYQQNLTFDGRPLATPYTAKALAWYMMARAAHQDLQREARMTALEQDIRGAIHEAETTTSPARKSAAERRVSELGLELDKLASAKDRTTQGAFIMKDPDNRIYRFLGAVPTCAARMSTHVGGRSAAKANHRIMGLFEYGSPGQKGIEDYQSTFPGPGGAMLFDSLRAGLSGQAELYVKFESAGCPALYQGAVKEGAVDRAVRFFAAIRRNVEHSINFTKTRSVKKGAVDPSERHEHAYKGALRKKVGDPFKKLVSRAVRLGVVGGSAQAFSDHMKEHGLHFVKDAVDQILANAQRLQANPQLAASMADIVRQCQSIQDAIAQETGRLNRFGPQDIESHGAEVHIDLLPPLPAT